MAEPQTSHSDIREEHHRNRVGHLDGIRAIAILAVVSFHWNRGALPGLFDGGSVGVDIFLVLSGYLITSILIGRPPASVSAGFAAFLKARVRRLYPALVALAIGVVILTMWASNGRFEALRPSVASIALTLVQLSWIPVVYAWGTHSFLLLHSWSLAVEWTFYLIWPWLLWRHTLHRRNAWQLVAGSSLILWLVSAAALPWEWFYAAPLSRAAQLGVGCAFALYRAQAPETQHPKANAHVRNLAIFWLSLGFIGYWTVFGPFAGASYRWGAFGLIPLATLGLIYTGFELALAQRLLALRPLTAIGRASYSLYLWHVPLALLISKKTLGLSNGKSGALLLVATAVATTASYWFLERPYFKSSSKRPTAQASHARVSQ